jgi:arsenate reductase
MKKMYHLSTCSTCRKIIAAVDATENGVALQNIKQEPISEKELDALKDMAGSYEALFSRKSTQYKALGLKDQVLGEADYKKYLLQHYSFLKRPVTIVGKQLFIGNDPKTTEALAAALKSN